MTDLTELKKEFLTARDHLLRSKKKQVDAFKFSMELSHLVEEYIRNIAGANKFNFALASAGSFSRRELSPFSDIDIMFIASSVEESKDEIASLVTKFWDSGMEVSHTIRDFSDIQKFAVEDLHTFTQFFETRFLLGSAKIYDQWNQDLINSLTEKLQVDILKKLIVDVQIRYDKYGDSPKLLEPNVKLSAGSLRDLQSIEWMYIIANKVLLNKQTELTQVEAFISILKENALTTCTECSRLLESYRLILGVRNLLHLISDQRTDRFEFTYQNKISKMFSHQTNALEIFMQSYFNASNTIYRFTKSMIKKFQDEITNPLPDSLSMDLDDDFVLKGKTIFYKGTKSPTLSIILRGFFYRGEHSARFDETFRSNIIEYAESHNDSDSIKNESSVFFREILKMPKNVGQTLSVMNELGLLGTFLPEFKELNGFMQHGVYHCYTADVHTLITIQNLEKLERDSSILGKIYSSFRTKEILFLAMLFHDIAKPINISGHEIIGSEMASSIMQRLGYSELEMNKVCFLVKNHLLMEQVAFRRNLNDPGTLNNFVSNFNTVEELDLLYLVTYADLSAVNSAVWTVWKSELLSELYRKSKEMIEQQITGEDLLINNTYVVPKQITKHSSEISEENVKEHIDALNDSAYMQQFSDEEIALHIEKINRGEQVSVIFKQLEHFTNVTIITRDFPSLLSKLCGVLSINDANIYDAKIFTRKDGIVIDTFNVADFRTEKKIEVARFAKIEKDFERVVNGLLQLNQEMTKLKSRWWRIESKFFNRSGKVKISFEKHERYTIIDVFSPDRLGFLYHLTHKMNELGLMIYFAKISTKGDDIVDSFYVLDRNNKKISESDLNFITEALLETIKQII
ncbi:MAG: HD domain-containing protein [Ignavibacteriales bacterium]|nr:HD domain-containing protein [Ignavibacteriales bacterium]